MSRVADQLKRLLQAPVLAELRRAGEAYLVGGAVRDMLMGRRPDDIDVVVADPEEATRRLARAAGGRVVRMHNAPVTLRVALEPGRWIDVCGIAGRTLREDLSKRDFTINAMAVAVKDGRLVDPFGGLADLRAGLVRLTDAGALEADAVRLLRAYRLAAELGFRLAPGTRAAIRERAGKLGQVAGQRVGHEMLKLLAADRAVAAAVRWAVADGVMGQVIPQILDMRGLGKGGYHHLDVLGHTLEALEFAERLMAAPRLKFSQAAELITAAVADGEGRAVVRAAVLLHDVGKPAAYYVDEGGRMWFRGHEDIGAAMAAELLKRWAWPRRLRVRVEAVVREHMRPLQLARDALSERPSVTLRAWKRLQRDVGAEDMAALFVVAAADVMAARGPASRGNERAAMIEVLDATLAELAAEEPGRPARLVRGDELMRELGVPQGPLLGRLLRAIERAHEAGEVSDRQEAIELARRLLKRPREAGGNTEAFADEGG